MRMFVAVVPPQHALAELDAFLEPRRDVDSPLRWTSPEQWHLTLAFLPHVEDRALDDLVERLERAGRRRAPFTARIAGAGAFPNAGRARVVWSGVEHEGVELARLATGVRAAASRAGAEVGGGTFHPHLTLARLPRPVEATRWLRVLEGFAGSPWETTEFELIASHLGEGPRRRPRYESFGAFEIGPPQVTPDEPT